MRIILSLLLAFNTHAAPSTRKAPIALSVPVQSSAVAVGDYEDIRVDSDRDQKVDLWVVKKGDTKISTSFKDGQADTVYIKKFTGDGFSEAVYQATPNNFTLVKFDHRSLLKTKDSPSSQNPNDDAPSADNSCVEDNKDVVSKLSQFTESLDISQFGSAAENAVACENPAATKALTTSLAMALKNNSFTDCMNSEKAFSVFSSKDKAALIYFSNKLKLDLKQIASLQNPKAIITCKDGDESSQTTAQFTEPGSIQFTIPKNQDWQTTRKSSKTLMYRELLHRAGLADDGVVNTLVKTCLGAGAIDIANDNTRFGAWDAVIPAASGVDNSIKNAAKADVANTKATRATTSNAPKRQIASTGIDSTAVGQNINVAREVSTAEIKQAIPSSDRLAVQSINKTDEGKVEALQESARQSAPVFAMADRAMGVMNTPALAAGDRYQSRYGRYESASESSANSRSPGINKAIDAAAAGDRDTTRVVEEIDLTKGTNTATTERTTNAATSNRMVASTGRTAIAAVPEADVGTGTDSSRSTGRGGTGSGTYFTGGTNNTRQVNTGNRRVASTQSSGGSMEPSRDEILTFISSADYLQVQSKLAEKGYSQRLSNNQITIIYSDGRPPVGAPTNTNRRTTVFQDDGRQFILQRK